MIGSLAARRRLLTILGMAGLSWGCGDSVQPVVVTSVEVTSPIGALLDVGGTAQLSATARDAEGKAVSGISLTWNSSHPAVVTISAAGFIEALDIGTATVHADAGSARGSLPLRVVDADLPGITTVATEPFAAALIGSVSSELRSRVQAALAECTAGAGEGRLEGIQSCIVTIQAEATDAGDATDNALLAVLLLFVDEIERKLNL